VSSSEDALRYLIANDAAVLAIVPATRIIVGDELPINTALPALLVSEIDSVPWNTISQSEPYHHVERVQVTAFCKGPLSSTSTGRQGVKALLALVLSACSTRYGTVNGTVIAAITPDIEVKNPYDDLAAIHSGSRDFLVRRNA